ncbi:trypsin-like peptidase domain-containing protein [Patescibacteria group bacterium]|nr:trypsin-like peptidase domain-containing protein [Patescibacteria group bacterium]
MNCTKTIQKIKSSIAFIATFGVDGAYSGSGSGFIYGKEDIVVTCNHVVKGCNNVMLKFPDSEEYFPAKIVLQDEEHDLALLKFESKKRSALSKGKLDNIQEGMEVIFAGYPLGWKDLTTHTGIISAIIKDATGITSYLIDGTVNSGNSGCPLMTIDGEVIGVVNAKKIASGGTLNKIDGMQTGALSLHGVDLVEIYKALTNNVQLGVGVAIPASYIPDHKVLDEKTVTK